MSCASQPQLSPDPQPSPELGTSVSGSLVSGDTRRNAAPSSGRESPFLRSHGHSKLVFYLSRFSLPSDPLPPLTHEDTPSRIGCQSWKGPSRLLNQDPRWRPPCLRSRSDSVEAAVGLKLGLLSSHAKKPESQCWLYHSPTPAPMSIFTGLRPFCVLSDPRSWGGDLSKEGTRALSSGTPA